MKVIGFETMKIDRATLLASIALGIALISLGLQLLPRNMSAPLFGSETHAWREIASFEGTGNTTTQSFYVPSYFWRISWNVTWKQGEDPARLGGGFSAYIYSPGAVESWQNAVGNIGIGTINPVGYNTGSKEFPGSGNEYFYFKIMTHLVQNWFIKVEAWS